MTQVEYYCIMSLSKIEHGLHKMEEKRATKPTKTETATNSAPVLHTCIGGSMSLAPFPQE